MQRTAARTKQRCATTITKRRELLEGKLLPFCAHKGFLQLRDLTVERMREFRRGWKYSPLSAAKRLEYLRAFFRFCVDAGWLERNPAAALKPSKVPHRLTLPFAEAEVDRLLVAARTLVDFGQYGPRIEPMVLLLRCPDISFPVLCSCCKGVHHTSRVDQSCPSVDRNRHS